MNPKIGILSLLLACSRAEDADGTKSAEQDLTWLSNVEHTGTSPELSPKSDSKFFGKDYPRDDRPPADPFHFKHPYPIVQDGSDFDKDYVKDENSDNGNWKAQTEYDRLRQKLAKERADVAKADGRKSRAEEELREAMRRHEAALKRAEAEAAEDAKDSTGQSSGMPSKKVHKEPSPGGLSYPGRVKVATGDTQKAMEALDKCKKELAEARQHLKDLMKELEEAKKQQEETEAAYEAWKKKEHDSRESAHSLKGSVKEEYKEYMAAREEYLKQQAIVAKMEQDIEVASAKVKDIRDSEDDDGGVTQQGGHHHKSAAQRPAVVAAVFMSLACLFL